jgi:hypothetical protein
MAGSLAQEGPVSSGWSGRPQHRSGGGAPGVADAGGRAHRVPPPTVRPHASDTSGKVFARSRTPLTKWVLPIGLFRVGCSARPLAQELCVTYKTAWTLAIKLQPIPQPESPMEALVHFPSRLSGWIVGGTSAS